MSDEKRAMEGRDPVTDNDIGFHRGLLDQEEWLQARNKEAIARENPAFHALQQSVLDLRTAAKNVEKTKPAQSPTSPAAAGAGAADVVGVPDASDKEALRMALREEAKRAKTYASASLVISGIEHDLVDVWAQRAEQGRRDAEAQTLATALAKLVAEVDTALGSQVQAAFAAGGELSKLPFPSSAGEELWPLPPTQVVVDGEGWLPVMAAGAKQGTQQQVIVQLSSGREALRVVTTDQVVACRRKSSSWRMSAQGYACEIAVGSPEKSAWLLWDTAAGVYRVQASAAVKFEARSVVLFDRHESLERELMQQRMSLPEPLRQRFTALLLAQTHPVVRHALIRTFCVAEKPEQGLEAAQLLSWLIQALMLSASAGKTEASFESWRWLGAAALGTRFKSAVDPYSLMWGYANPLYALQLLCGGEKMKAVVDKANTQTTTARLVNRELAQRVARSTVRYVEVEGAHVAPRFEAHVQAQWAEGLLVERKGQHALVIAQQQRGEVQEFTAIQSQGLSTLTAEEPPRKLLLRVNPIADETPEARDKLEKSLRHALLAKPKGGVLVGFVVPGGSRVSSGVPVEGAELWLVNQVDVRGTQVGYRLTRFSEAAVPEEWSASLADLLNGRPSGAKLQFVEMLRTAKPKLK